MIVDGLYAPNLLSTSRAARSAWNTHQMQNKISCYSFEPRLSLPPRSISGCVRRWFTMAIEGGGGTKKLHTQNPKTAPERLGNR